MGQAGPPRPSTLLPSGLCSAVLAGLAELARGLANMRVSANAVTSASIALGALAGILVARGEFAWAAVTMMSASLGDALDGLLARQSGAASISGALLDAAGDRYQEFFFLGGLAVFFRGAVVPLVVTLAALAGAFMVSYGSAKAEALCVPVPPSLMRRAERAVCLCLAMALSAPWSWFARRVGLTGWVAALPAFVAVCLIAVVANASAIRRLRVVAVAAKAGSHERVHTTLDGVHCGSPRPEPSKAVAGQHALRAP